MSSSFVAVPMHSDFLPLGVCMSDSHSQSVALPHAPQQLPQHSFTFTQQHERRPSFEHLQQFLEYSNYHSTHSLESTYCSDYVCCNQRIPDLHSLLAHQEACHSAYSSQDNLNYPSIHTPPLSTAPSSPDSSRGSSFSSDPPSPVDYSLTDSVATQVYEYSPAQIYDQGIRWAHSQQQYCPPALDLTNVYPPHPEYCVPAQFTDARPAQMQSHPVIHLLEHVPVPYGEVPAPPTIPVMGHVMEEPIISRYITQRHAPRPTTDHPAQLTLNPLSISAPPIARQKRARSPSPVASSPVEPPAVVVIPAAQTPATPSPISTSPADSPISSLPPAIEEMYGSESSDSSSNSKKNKRRRGLNRNSPPSEKPYKCPHPNCVKAYLNPNGLSYHLKKGTCDYANSS